jgi:Urocanase Rossmann-like domain
LAPDPDSAAAHGFIVQTYDYYAGLMRGLQADAAVDVPESPGLGGQLFWAGKLDATGRALTVAGNIAGAATLAATSDADGQRLAVRDGIADFLVNSLDEALRILKNEVRKRETVAVCVAAPLEAVEREMVERGVRPDVFREGVVRAAERATQAKFGESKTDPISAGALVAWRVDRAPALWLPKIDAIALDCLDPEETIAKRWLLRSSRYLGRLGQAEHLVWSSREFAAHLVERIREGTNRGEVKVGGSVQVFSSGIGADQFYFNSPENTGDAASQA